MRANDGELRKSAGKKKMERKGRAAISDMLRDSYGDALTPDHNGPAGNAVFGHDPPPNSAVNARGARKQRLIASQNKKIRRQPGGGCRRIPQNSPARPERAADLMDNGT